MRYFKHSQNFLSTPQTIKKIIKLANLTSQDTVLDIGAGTGQLAKLLAPKVKQVVAIEKDANLARLLAKKVSEFDNIEILSDDFNLVDLDRWPNFKVVSNLPFNYTSDILNRLYDSNVSNIYVIIQKEVARKYLGQPKETLKSLLLKSKFVPKILTDLRRTDFRPQPAVDIVFLHMQRVPDNSWNQALQTQWEDFLAYTFSRNNPYLVKALEQIITYRQFKILSRTIVFNLSSEVTALSFQQWKGLFGFYLQQVEDNKKSSVRGSYQKYLVQRNGIQKIHRTTTSGRFAQSN